MEWCKKDNTIYAENEDITFALSFPKGGSVRFLYGPRQETGVWCPILQGEPELLECVAEAAAGSAKQTDGPLAVSAGDLNVTVDADGGLCVRKDGIVRWRTPAHAFATDGEVSRLRFWSGGDEVVYGLGQDPMARLDHNHQERRMWNQWGGHTRSGNCGIGLSVSTGGYGMLLATPVDARFRFHESEPQEIDPLGEAMVPSLWEEAMPCQEGTACVEARGALDLFLLFGTPEEILRGYYGLTGFPALMPKWAYGFLQCKNRYMNQNDLLFVARRMRREGIPCDGLIIDWLWFEEFGDLEWKKEDWPDAKGMLAELAQMGFAVSCAQHPFISEQGRYYREYEENGYLNLVPEGKRVTYDHTNPAARAHWWEKASRLYRQGLRGYWTDMGELEEHFDGTVSAAGDRTTTHNAYALLWTQGLAEGQRREYGTRPFILSRSGCAGIQKYGTAIWSGDIDASWQVLRDQVILAQTMALSGIPWWGTDIGGFLSGAECTPELYVRWMEWGVFCGLFRTHGTRPGNEPWSFGSEAQRRIHALIRLRYQLLPYIYSLAMQCALKGTLLIRPMGLAFPGDEEAAACKGAYLFGPSLLVAPVTEPGVRRAAVYLPTGTWYHWWSGKPYNAGWCEVPAPPGQIPLFVRAGAILPVYARTGRNAADCGELCLIDVPTERESLCPEESFDYYDDDGTGFAYEEGQYTHVRFVRENGKIKTIALRGEAPEYKVKRWNGGGCTDAAQDSAASDIAVTDSAWHGDEAEITITFLQDCVCRITFLPETGWYVTACTAETGAGYLEEPAYQRRWEGDCMGRAGDCICWRLVHTQHMRRVGVQTAQLILLTEDGKRCELSAEWDGPFLCDPDVLGVFPPGTALRGFAPECDPGAPEYQWDGKIWRWEKDSLFARNSYGYVDFRRFDPVRKGEEMLGEAWARENLYSKTDQQVELELRYDSPVVIWLNGVQIFEGNQRNDTGIRMICPLAQGENVLIIRQIAQIARPYSGGEFGYSIRLAGMHKIFSMK